MHVFVETFTNGLSSNLPGHKPSVAERSAYGPRHPGHMSQVPDLEENPRRCQMRYSNQSGKRRGNRSTAQKWHQLGTEILPYPPHSPNLFPIDFHFFRLLDNFLTQKRFRKQKDIENAFQQFLSFRDLDF
ncbi:Histone-lysine N-methyltransferase SETMAR [Habropoda laboriosa]|uniref:Histone-lysine N-methyltransferase SETMAR n=1 Tax=Habropoda laboriosa TaxID=597456 RepID=A0A0L7RIT4_9HYME|nr:Histone-lysine N-methyltransferase SETMAR [Habropoda laboriosa]